MISSYQQQLDCFLLATLLVFFVNVSFFPEKITLPYFRQLCYLCFVFYNILFSLLDHCPNFAPIGNTVRDVKSCKNSVLSVLFRFLMS